MYTKSPAASCTTAVFDCVPLVSGRHSQSKPTTLSFRACSHSCAIASSSSLVQYTIVTVCSLPCMCTFCCNVLRRCLRLRHCHCNASTLKAKPAHPVAVAACIIGRSEEHTSELQSLMRISYAVFCLKKKKNHTSHTRNKK